MKMSPLGGLADETCDEADIRLLMSVVGGRADVACQGLSGPFLAKTSRTIDSNKRLLYGQSSPNTVDDLLAYETDFSVIFVRQHPSLPGDHNSSS